MPPPSARDQLLAHGYQGATIESVAAGAGVVPQTVYAAFGTKRGLLGVVVDAAIAGDDEPVPVAEREWISAIADIGDPREAFAAVAAGSTSIFARVGPVYRLVQAASADEAVAELLHGLRRGRRSDQREIARLLYAAGHLSPGVSVEHAGDVLYGLVNEEVHHLLAIECEWGDDRFCSWLTQVVVAELAPPRASTAGS